MTRRPKSRLPPKLPDYARESAPAERRPPNRDPTDQGRARRRAQRAVRSRGRRLHVMRALVRGDVPARLGLPPFADLTFDHAAAAAALIFGWDGDGPRARIDPARTVEGFDAACTRVLEVARGGGRLAFATSRPASLLGLHQALADAASEAGGEVLSAMQSAPIDERGHRIWWIDDVATVTDGESLLADRVERGRRRVALRTATPGPRRGRPLLRGHRGRRRPRGRGVRGPRRDRAGRCVLARHGSPGGPARRAWSPPGLRPPPGAPGRSGRGTRSPTR